MLNYICEISRNGIVEQAIGAFLGFVFALLSAWITAIIAKRIKICTLRKRVYTELAEVYFCITSRENNETLLYYDCPIWDSIIASAMLLEMGDNAFLQPLVEIYGRLNILRGQEQKMLEEDETQNPSSDIIGKRKKLAAIIQNSILFKKMEQVAKKTIKR